MNKLLTTTLLAIGLVSCNENRMKMRIDDVNVVDNYVAGAVAKVSMSNGVDTLVADIIPPLEKDNEFQKYPTISDGKHPKQKAYNTQLMNSIKVGDSITFDNNFVYRTSGSLSYQNITIDSSYRK